MKKIVLIFLSFVIYFNSIANAATPLDTPMRGWSITGGIAQGASAAYNATRNALINGKNVAKTSAAVITPAAADVAKVLGKGVAGVALSVAVEQLLGAVDWVLDPANNQIKYWDEPDNPYFLGAVGSDVFGEGKTREEACKMYATAYHKKYGGGSTLYYYSTVGIQGDVTPTSSYFCYLSKMVYSTVSTNAVRVEGNINVKELGNTDGEVKTYPLPAISDYLIKKAEGGNTTAQTATMAAAADIVQDAETDSVKARPIVDQLNANAVTPTSETATGTATQTDTKTDPATGETTTETKATDLALDFPLFCTWAPSVCEAAAVVLTFPITLNNWWETSTKAISNAWVEAKEWASSENKNEEKDTEVELIDEALPDVNTNIFGASGECPPDFTYPFPLPMGGTYTISYSYATVCTWFSKLYYIVISVAWIIAFRIVTNTNSGNSDG